MRAKSPVMKFASYLMSSKSTYHNAGPAHGGAKVKEANVDMRDASFHAMSFRGTNPMAKMSLAKEEAVPATGGAPRNSSKPTEPGSPTRRSKRKPQSAPPLEAFVIGARWPAVPKGVVQEVVGSLQAALQQPFRKHCEPYAG